MQDTSERLAALGDLPGEAAYEEEEDDDDLDTGPLPEVSELRARAMAIAGTPASSSSSGAEGRRAGGPPKVIEGDHRREMQGAVEEAVQRRQAGADALAEDQRCVRITSTRGQGVNIAAVAGFCAKFGEVVAMRLEGSGSEASAVIEYRTAPETQACLRQRDSESLKVTLCPSTG